MPKGYWIASLDVWDADKYKEYVKANAQAFAKYEAKFLTRGGAYHQMEGYARARNVVLEFPSVKHALDCFNSAEYKAALKIRRDISEGDIVIVEGYDGPQPPEQPGEAAKVTES